MKSKKLIPRVLATITTIALMLTSTPLNTLTTFAAGGGGAGGGFGGGGNATPVSDNPINDDDIGLRFSLVTKDASGTRVVQNIYGDYYVDAWPDYSYSESWYDAVNYYSRYAPNTGHRQ